MHQDNRAASNPSRCAWASNDLRTCYHDEEWGVPLHADRALFEFLILWDPPDGRGHDGLRPWHV
jgi:hypothetical protein